MGRAEALAKADSPFCFLPSDFPLCALRFPSFPMSKNCPDHIPSEGPCLVKNINLRYVGAAGVAASLCRGVRPFSFPLLRRSQQPRALTAGAGGQPRPFNECVPLQGGDTGVGTS